MAEVIDFNDAGPQSPALIKNDRLDKIKSALDSRATSFVQELFGAARIMRGEARVGSLQGEAGESLWIGLSGDKSGQWIDHATGEKGGDLISLYAAAEGLDLKSDFLRIMDDLEGMLGLSQTPPKATLRRIAREAHKDEAPKLQEGLPAPSMTWYYHDEVSGLIATVDRFDKENGSKTYRPWDAAVGRYAMPAIRPLYNIPGIILSEPVVLVEGEKCADVLIQLGWAATTAMGGARAPLDRTDWGPISGKRIIVWADNDIPGQQWEKSVSEYLANLGCTVTKVKIPSSSPHKWDVADAIKQENGAALARQLLQEAVDAQSAPKPQRFKILSLDQLNELDPPEWMVDNYLPEFGFSVMYGPSASFKSFVALDLALHIAHEKPWCGRQTTRKAVIYIAAEGGFGLQKRAMAWHAQHKLPVATNVFVLPSVVDLIDPAVDIDPLMAQLDDYQGLDIGLIVVDTLARAFVGGDENATKDMNVFVANCDRIRSRFNCLVMAIHHSGKDEAKGARGSSVLRAATDTEISVKRIEGTNRVTISCKKQKEAEEAGDIQMDAVGVPVVNKYGEISGSLVLREISDKASAKRKIGVVERSILEAVEGISVGLTFSELVRKTNNRKSSIARSLISLISSGLVVQEGDVYTLATENETSRETNDE
jgi:hypothetical protein